MGEDVMCEKNRQEAKSSLEKYLFFFERFMNHQKASQVAKDQLHATAPKWVQELHQKYSLSFDETEFILDALGQVVLCRQVLKWTYVYAYYESEEAPTNVSTRRVSGEIFDYLQKNLEEKTDRLHEFVEKDLTAWVPGDDDAEATSANNSIVETVSLDPMVAKNEFLEFRSRVCSYLAVTKNFCEKIVAELHS
jgi:ariadne-1